MSATLRNAPVPARRLRSLAFALALGVAAPWVSAQAGGESPLNARDLVKAQAEGGLAGITRVAIPTFIVQLVRDEGIEREGGSFGMFQKQSATYFVQNRGVDAAQLQALADTLYDSFVQDLATVGVTVVPIAEMDANEDMQSVRKAAKTSPQTLQFERGIGKKKVMSVNLLASAKDLPIVVRYTSDERWLPPVAAMGEALQGTTLVLGAAKAASALQAALLNVRLTVSMIEPKGKGYGNSGYSRWEFDADPSPRFVEGGTTVTLSHATDANLLRLAKPVPIAGIDFKGAKGEGGASSRGSGLLGAIGRAISGGDAEGADAYVDIEPASFSNQVGAQGRRVLRLFIESMTGKSPA
jgi:hypothetical protein